MNPVSSSPTAPSNVLDRTAPAHALPAAAFLDQLETTAASGLTEEEARRRLEKVGPNAMAPPPRMPLWRKLVERFNDLLSWLLLAAALLSLGVGEWLDAAAIGAILLLNALLGFIQEQRAEQALAALRRLAAPTARVLRAGNWRTISAAALVPGDIVDLQAGDHVPADCRLLRAFGLAARESALTGESTPVVKAANATLDPVVPLAERRNVVYLGTQIVAGKGDGVVVATGMATELGQIAGMLEHPNAEPTPLQRDLAGFAQALLVACLGLVACVLMLELWHGNPLLEALLLSVSLAVAAVPEGLPAVVTLALAVGLRRMARRNALIRKLASVETLGSVTVICSDKTGTLTRDEMTVREIVVGRSHYRVTGAGYEPQGAFLLEQGEQWRAVADPLADEDLALLLHAAALCNNARLELGASARIVGDATEGALLVAARKAGVDVSGQGESVLHELPFDSERKAMSVIVAAPGGTRRMYSKGAPEALLPRCRAERVGGRVVELDEPRRRELNAIESALASRALRVLAVAYRDLPADTPPERALEEELVFCGVAGMIDPPRAEAKAAVARCRAAGILPVMITGDHARTAHAIARELDIAAESSSVVAGPELARWTREELEQNVARIRVYARVSAADKLRVVRAWQARGQIVAMTGDGVNDAPAVQAADVGVAMGATGTDVTRQAAAMVLLDDNFASIVGAVEEGRTIYANIRKFLVYLLSCNTGEMLLIFLASLLGWPSPLLPAQLLWINLVTDGLAALALGLEPPEPGIMERPPRPRGRGMVTWSLARGVLGQGILVALVALGVFAVFHGAAEGTLERARTMTFCVLVCDELLRAFTARSRSLPLWRLGLFTNPHLVVAAGASLALQFALVSLPFTRVLFSLTELSLGDWGIVLAVGLVPAALIEAHKAFWFHWSGKGRGVPPSS